MKVAKIIGGLLLLYVAVVTTFESLLGVFQPANQSTLVITTSDESGNMNSRVLTRLESQNRLYVAANHWPRVWYNQALKNPHVVIEIDGEQKNYLAVPISGAEHDQVQSDNSVGLGFRVLTGFPPRYFVRLDERDG